jgi:hypothetical protein
MTRLVLSPAALGLLRALIARTGIPRERVLLSECRSTDWQSLTFEGERHEIRLRILGPDSATATERLLDGLAEAEFAIPGQIVADIAVTGAAQTHADGGIELGLEALTISE